MIISQDATSQPYTNVTTLGKINRVDTNTNDNDDSPSKDESTVVMSEKNFRTLIALIPTTSTRQYLFNAIIAMKNKLTQLSFTNDQNEAQLSDYLEMLQDELNWQSFQDDVVEFGKLPMIIGHINLNEEDV
jgi:hypothetical protein